MGKYRVLGMCSGNVLRSPTFEAITNYSLEIANRSDVKVSSAGLNVEKILANESPLSKMLWIIDAGLHYNLVRKDKQCEAKALVKKYQAIDPKEVPGEDIFAIASLYMDVRPALHGRLTGYRDIALEKAGIPEKFIPAIYNPFNPEDNFDLIIPMEKSLLDKTVELYDGTKPTILTYGDLVGQEDIVDELTGGLDMVMRQVDYFMSTRDKSLTNILKLLENKK